MAAIGIDDRCVKRKDRAYDNRIQLLVGGSSDPAISQPYADRAGREVLESDE